MTPTVGDLLAYGALPVEVREVCERAYGGTPEDIESRVAEAVEEAESEARCDGDCDAAVKLQEALDEIEGIVRRAQS